MESKASSSVAGSVPSAWLQPMHGGWNPPGQSQRNDEIAHILTVKETGQVAFHQSVLSGTRVGPIESLADAATLSSLACSPHSHSRVSGDKPLKGKLW